MMRTWPTVRRGFTLLELMVVLAIAAALIGGVAVSLRGHFQRAALARAIDQAIAADRLARTMARDDSATQVTLSFDPTERHIILSGTLSSATRDAAPRVFTWPRQVTAEFPRRLSSRGWEPMQGSVPFTENGNSQTYAIRFTSGELSRSVVILGLTGQPTVYDASEPEREFQP